MIVDFSKIDDLKPGDFCPHPPELMYHDWEMFPGDPDAPPVRVVTCGQCGYLFPPPYLRVVTLEPSK